MSIIYIEGPIQNKMKNKKLQLISEFNKVTRYKINTEKPIIFPFPSKKHVENKVCLLVYLLIEDQNLKYNAIYNHSKKYELLINLTKYIWDLYFT